jgi:hypothetical protein
MNRHEDDSLWLLDFLVDCESTPFATLFSSVKLDNDPRLPADVATLLSLVRTFVEAGLLDARSVGPDGKRRTLNDVEWNRLAREYVAWLPAAGTREVFLDPSGLWLNLTSLGREKWKALPESEAQPRGERPAT